MPKDNADISMRVEKRQDGSLVLRGLPGAEPVWPAKHEFSQDWLLENSAAVEMDSSEIHLTFANGEATYKIRRDWMVNEVTLDDKEMADILGKKVGDAHTFTLSTGYWGELKDGKITKAHEVDPKMYKVREAHDNGAAGHEGLSGECDACNNVRRSLAKERSNG